MDFNEKVNFYIVTVCFNSEKTITKTIESVLAQTYSNYYYIIIDGGSTDNTIKIINDYKKKFKDRLYYISEEDSGIYDAMNKAVKLIKKENAYIMFLNSDDYLFSKKTLKLMRNFKNDFLYGKVVLSDNNFKYTVGSSVKLQSFYNNFPRQPSVFIKRKVFSLVGLFSLSYDIAGDYEFFVRVFKEKNISKRFTNQNISFMTLRGISNNLIFRSYLQKFIIIKNNFEFFFIIKSFFFIFLYQIPRNFIRIFLVRFGLISLWRKVKSHYAEKFNYK
jgi:glycosyltransferase involved in cell wall biosynthesis